MSPIPLGPGHRTHFLGFSVIFLSIAQSKHGQAFALQSAAPMEIYQPSSLVVQTLPNSASWRIHVSEGLYSCFILNPYGYWDGSHWNRLGRTDSLLCQQDCRSRNTQWTNPSLFIFFTMSPKRRQLKIISLHVNCRLECSMLYRISLHCH